VVQRLRSNPHHLGHKVMGALGKGRLLPASAARLRILISSQLIGKLATEMSEIGCGQAAAHPNRDPTCPAESRRASVGIALALGNEALEVVLLDR